ncbi:glutathione S-transferase family protein, partial [Reyranella sp.]|uniref:glutathione S-transferase family protein n=1 Tax=Reyranella sp. TaxID=1929291 RepID=UPI002F954E9A
MSLVLHGHPFSSYTQKILTALYENVTPFAWCVLDGPAAFEELAGMWPIRLMPVLVDSGMPVIESTIIIEHLTLAHPGPVCLIPTDPKAALKVRFLDRFFDWYIMTPMQKIVGDKLRQEGERDPKGVADAKSRLDVSYGWLEKELSGRQWAAGDVFTLADCAAAPALFYADWVHPIGVEFGMVRAYRARLLARPSFARAVEEARPFRPLFP